MNIQTEEIKSSLLKEKDIHLFIKRIDRLHPFISGNKWFKLKYNLLEAKEKGYHTVLTFGGAYSNHIYSTAYIANEMGLNSIGLIRGEEHTPLNYTLNYVTSQGMFLHYVSREDYRKKTDNSFLEGLKRKFGEFYTIPEGGTNNLAIQGVSEILVKEDSQDFICCPVGTGGTISGLISSVNKEQKVLGFLSVKDRDRINIFLKSQFSDNRFNLIDDYCFGGYAKINNELVKFINQFYLEYNIVLDAIYTAKMMFGILELVRANFFKRKSTILAIHTGGVQGNIGLNERLGLDLPF